MNSPTKIDRMVSELRAAHARRLDGIVKAALLAVLVAWNVFLWLN